MGVIDPTACPVKTGSIYPEPYAAQMAGRSSLRLGEAAGLTQFGANSSTLAPGARSSLRHWHAAEDEFVMVTEGELILVQDEGEYTLRPGDCAAWQAGDPTATASSTAPTARPASSSSAAKAAHEVATYSDLDLVLRAATDGAARPSPTATAPRGPARDDAQTRICVVHALCMRCASPFHLTARRPAMAIFTLDTDADGVATITWDLPGRSMNVLTLDGIAELDAADRPRPSPTPP